MGVYAGMPEPPKVPEKQDLGDLVRRAMSDAAESGGAKGRPRTSRKTPPPKTTRKKGATSVKKRKATTHVRAKTPPDVSPPWQEGRLRTLPENAKSTARTVISIMRNEILGATERALYEFFPALGRAVMACISKLTDAEARNFRANSVSKVTMSVEQVEGVVAELSSIETVCGKRMIFGQIPLCDASAAWRALLI